jgi:hypothetical protein
MDTSKHQSFSQTSISVIKSIVKPIIFKHFINNGILTISMDALGLMLAISA